MASLRASATHWRRDASNKYPSGEFSGCGYASKENTSCSRKGK